MGFFRNIANTLPSTKIYAHRGGGGVAIGRTRKVQFSQTTSKASMFSRVPFHNPRYEKQIKIFIDKGRLGTNNDDNNTSRQKQLLFPSFQFIIYFESTLHPFNIYQNSG